MDRKFELIERLSVARQTGHLPASLGDALHAHLCNTLPVFARRALQADYLRQAAELLDGTPWQRAERLATLIRQWSGRRGESPLKQALYHAALLGRLPESPRHLYRILTETDA
ncbi:MAG TPA: hypothetical protein PLP22_10585 [Candidatus Competibacter sp.]|nr:hypothetical protein [Candidatus Competibacteraceae bacterium]HRE55223.1 hypothetical protein [Candidatus Competibacter sp.]HUM96107.1 hypothetical protein [Candidatus Competibacter sp.]